MLFAIENDELFKDIYRIPGSKFHGQIALLVAEVMYYHYCFANQEHVFLPSYGEVEENIWLVYVCLWFFKQQSDLDHSQNSSNRANPKSVGSGNKQMRPAVSNQRQVLRRSFSQKDLKSHDGYSVILFLLLWLIVLLLLFIYVENGGEKKGLGVL